MDRGGNARLKASFLGPLFGDYWILDRSDDLLRAELAVRNILPRSVLADMRDGRWINIAGLVLVRQKPGSAKGVMFITLEDETDIANLVGWPDLFEEHRRVALGASMMAETPRDHLHSGPSPGRGDHSRPADRGDQYQAQGFSVRVIWERNACRVTARSIHEED